jgi:hypothetical protein
VFEEFVVAIDEGFHWGHEVPCFQISVLIRIEICFYLKEEYLLDGEEVEFVVKNTTGLYLLVDVSRSKVGVLVRDEEEKRLGESRSRVDVNLYSVVERSNEGRSDATGVRGREVIESLSIDPPNLPE